MAQYRRALKISPDQASVHSNLGTAYFARNQLDPAVAGKVVASLRAHPGATTASPASPTRTR